MSEEDKVLKELHEIKALLQRSQRTADIQWVYNIGFAALLGSLALVSIKAEAWQIIGVGFAGLALMMLAPCFAKK